MKNPILPVSNVTACGRHAYGVCLLVLLLVLGCPCFSQSGSSLQQARKEYQDDNYAEAIKLLEKAAAEEPQNAQVPYLTGRAYMDMNNYKKAASFLEKAIAMDSTKSNW